MRDIFRNSQDSGDFSQGSVFGTLIRMAVPMSLALLINILYSIVDRIYIGHIPDVGQLSLTGIGLVAPIVTVIVAFQNLFGAGGMPLFSMARGRKDRYRTSLVIHNACFMLLLIGVLLTLAIEAAAPQLLMLIGASDATFEYALSYLRIYALGTVFVMFSLGMNPYINAQGNVKTGMATVMIGAVVNIILDPIFIFGFKMGVSGAAIATVIAQFCSALWVLVFFCRESEEKLFLSKLKPDFAVIGEICSLGVTEFVFQITNSIVMMLYNIILLRLGGDIYVTSMTVIYSIREFTNVIMFGVVGAAKPIMSYNYGAGCYGRTKQTIKYMTGINFVYLSMIWICVMTFPESFIRVFNDDPLLVETAGHCIKTFFVFYMFGALQVSAQSAFVSLGKAKYALFFSLLRKVFLIIPLIYIMPYVFKQGAMGVFMAEPLSELIGGSLCFITMCATVWKELSNAPSNSISSN